MSLVTIHYNKKSFQSYSWINQMMLHKILFKVAAILHSLSIFRSALILLIQFVLFSFFVVTSTGSLFLFLTFSYFFYFSLPFFLHICLFYFYPYFVFFFFFFRNCSDPVYQFESIEFYMCSITRVSLMQYLLILVLFNC